MDNSELECNFILNCVGGNSLDIAKQFGLLKSFSDLHFRGEYWIAEKTGKFSPRQFKVL